MLCLERHSNSADRLQEFLSAYEQTRTGDTDLMIAVDIEDGPWWQDIERPARTHVALAPRMNLGPKLNQYAVAAAEI